MFIDRHITRTKVPIINVIQVVRYFTVGALLLLKSVTTFLKTGTSGIDVFSKRHKFTTKLVKQFKSWCKLYRYYWRDKSD